jgi:hypothetical protein
MTRSPRRASPPLAGALTFTGALAATAVALAGCGTSALTDREQIGAIVKAEGTQPATVCHHLTDALLARFGGLSNCLSRAASATHDPSTRATQVAVRGNTATATVTGAAGNRSIALVKYKGSWLISSVR